MPSPQQAHLGVGPAAARTNITVVSTSAAFGCPYTHDVTSQEAGLHEQGRIWSEMGK
jgi:hypothetical protein